MQIDLLIRNCTLLGEALGPIKDMSVAVSGNAIYEILPTAEDSKFAAAETIEAGGKLLLPGFVDAHTHVCQQLLRGKTTDEYPMIWTRFLVPFESNLTEEDVYISTQLACLEMIKAGITSFADAGGVHMQRAADAVIGSGMRAALCRSTMDIGGNIPDSMKETAADHMRHTEEFYDEYNGAGDGCVDVWFGMRQVMTCSPELIEQSAARAKELGTGLHAHLCEHKDEVSFCLQNYKLRPAAFLERCGALGPNLLTAHNVVLSEGDITLMAERDVKVVHCPQANLANHGFPKTPRILECGLSVGIGNDGASAVALDHFEQLRVLKNGVIAYWGLPVFDPVVLPTPALLRMGSQGGADAIGKAGLLGSVEPGKLADLILLDISGPHMNPTQNLAHTLISCGSGRDVTHTIINGKLVMKDREVLTLDEREVIAKAGETMRDINRRAGI